MKRIPINKEWSNRLYSLRCERKLLQYEVAINCKIGKVLYNRLETGKVNTVSEKVLKQLEEFFETSLTPLNTDEDVTKEIMALREENMLLRKLLLRELSKSNKADELAKDILADMAGLNNAFTHDQITRKIIFGGV